MKRRLQYWYSRAVVWACTAGVLLTSCAATRRAVDTVGEKGTQAGGGVLVGMLLWLAHPVGWVGAGLAAVGGAIGALMFGGGSVTIHEAPAGFPWVGLASLVLLVLLARSWAHWLPGLIEVVKRTVKGTPRALLGGKPKPAEKPKFVRRTD
jgi:hypothetical protein